MAIAWVACAWILAWNRFEWFQPWQQHTFPLLWFGYIVIINSITYTRTGHCLMLDQRKFFCKLFFLSAGFWWVFEYLNQFVYNWHYIGIPIPESWTTIFFMTLSFSTVLPAVLGTRECLASFPRLTAPFTKWHTTTVFESPHIGWHVFLIGSLTLGTIGLWPTLLFPLLWVSPLLMMVGLKTIRREPTFLSSLTQGNWNPIVLPALAALICGGFWEMWNFFSLVHWEYTIPYVHAFKVFEMPILGYSGYLPFGLECVAVVDFFLRAPTEK